VFEPIIRLLTPQSITLEPGETRDIQLTLRNIGINTASEIITTVSTTGPYKVEVIGTNRIVSIPQNQERNLNLRITANADAPFGAGPDILLRHDFRTAQPATGSTSNLLAVHIAGEVTMPPAIQLSNFRGLDIPVEPGQIFTVMADVTNTGQSAAHNVQITFPNLSNQIAVTSDLNQALIPALAPGQTRTLAFSFQTANNIPRVTQTIEFQASFTNEANRAQEPVKFLRFINIAPEEDEPDTLANLEIRDLTAPTGRFEPGQIAEFSLELFNSGDTVLTFIRVAATPPSFIDPMSQTQFVIPSLAPGESWQMNFRFTPDEAARSRTYNIEFVANYSVNGVDAPSVLQFAAINVYNPGTEEEETKYDEVNRPWLIMETFTVDPMVPRAGQNFTMIITFRNTSEIHPIQNTRIVFTPIGGTNQGDIVFIPVGGSSNTVFIDFIPPGGSVTKEMDFFTVGDAFPRSYTMRVNKSYHSPALRQQAEEHVDLSIRVSQFVRLETVQDFWMPSMVNVGDPIRIDLQVINSGRVTLHNVRLRVEENNPDPNNPMFDTSEANLPLGEMGPSRWLMYNGMFRPLVPGFIMGDIIIYGEDPAFELVEHRIPFEVYVMDPWSEGGDPWSNDPWNDPWMNDPWMNDPWADPWAQEPEEELGWFRRLWRWLTTPIGGYAGSRRNQNNPQQEIPWQGDIWGYENGGGIEPMGISVSVPRGVVVTDRAQVVRPQPPGNPGMNAWDDPWGQEETGSDNFFIHLWNFIRMPIVVFPFGLGVGAGVTILVIKLKKRNAEMMDFDE
jgi:hypothetical protein